MALSRAGWTVRAWGSVGAVGRDTNGPVPCLADALQKNQPDLHTAACEDLASGRGEDNVPVTGLSDRAVWWCCPSGEGLGED